MELLFLFTKWSIYLLLTAYFITLVVMMMTGHINMQNLLNDKKSREFTMSRLQLLLFTLFVAGYYLLLTFGSSAGKLPAIPNAFLMALGGSQATYLSAKTMSYFKFIASQKN